MVYSAVASTAETLQEEEDLSYIHTAVFQSDAQSASSLTTWRLQLSTSDCVSTEFECVTFLVFWGISVKQWCRTKQCLIDVN